MGCSASRPNTTLFSRSHYCSEDMSCSSSSLESMVSAHSSPKVARALSLPTPLVHHPPLRKGDTHHLVSLTSTTYGSLLLIDTKSPNSNRRDCPDNQPLSPPRKTPPVPADPGESLSPDSVINTWELMDGLDDDSDFDLGKPKSSSIFSNSKELSLKANAFTYKALTGPAKTLQESFEAMKKCEDNPVPQLTKPLWKHLSEESLLSKMDPNVVLSYRRALSSRQLGINNESRDTRSVGSSPLCSTLSDSWARVPGTNYRIVLYFTSLRGIRKTYEDCCTVRMIFRGFRVLVDERDISMDSMYRKELQSLLGGKAISLPQVFIRGKHIGGVEEIKQLNESGDLAKLLEGFPVRDPGIVCQSCGDARFVPCSNCSGSRKVFDEDQGQLRRCSHCNENGLIRCPGCCS